MKRILVAGVGNIFRGDDGFGPEVVRRLLQRPIPEGVRAIDFATRGHDLAYAILDGYDGVVFVDVTSRDGQPGTLYTLELDPLTACASGLRLDARRCNPFGATSGSCLALWCTSGLSTVFCL